MVKLKRFVFNKRLVFVALQHWLPDGSANVIIAATVTLLIRFAAIRWKLALPVFKPREKS